MLQCNKLEVETGLSDALLLSIVATGFTVAFFHAALPTHWLPFVLVGRAQGWSAGRIAAVTAVAGTGHVAFTVVLGALVAGAGLAIEHWLGAFAPYVAAGLLFALGAFYLGRHAVAVRRLAGAPALEATAPRYASDRAAVGALVLLLTVSPCEAFLPIYLSAASYGWGAFALLSGVLAVATAAGMTVFTTAFLLGAKRLKLQSLERYDSLILGGVLCLLGVAVLVLER